MNEGICAKLKFKIFERQRAPSIKRQSKAAKCIENNNNVDEAGDDDDDAASA